MTFILRIGKEGLIIASTQIFPICRIKGKIKNGIDVRFDSILIQIGTCMDSSTTLK